MKISKKIIFRILILVLILAVLVSGIIINQEANDNNNKKTQDSEIKNIIFMIGDGMGENHIRAGEIYKGEKLNIQEIENKTYVTTSSKSEITDSAAAATALASGHKTNNGVVGKDENGNDLENLTEYFNSKGLKTGIIATQILNHATPAGFSAHNVSRFNYEEIAQSQIKSCVNIMLGGGREYFSKYESQILENNYKWINNVDELENIGKDEKVIGTFAEQSISQEDDRVSLSKMTEVALSKLENDKGFFLMVEGSDIDTYSHKTDISKMLTEIIDFDEAVKTAMSYVDKHPDTLLIVTADHETGGLDLEGITTKEQLTNLLFKSNGAHTSRNVLLYAYGAGAEKLTHEKLIDNTEICKFIKQEISIK